MDRKRSNLGSWGFWFLWTISTACVWFIIVFPGLSYRDMKFTSWSEITPIAWQFFLMTFMLGLAVGILQYGVLWLIQKPHFLWVVISCASYAIGSLLALLLSFFLIGLRFPSALSGSAGTLVAMPLGFTMLLGGGLAGIIQALYLKRYMEPKQTLKILLWTFGTAMAWGLGFIATAFAWGKGWSINLQSSLGGAVIGAITGLIYLMMLKKELPGKSQAGQSS